MSKTWGSELIIRFPGLGTKQIIQDIVTSKLKSFIQETLFHKSNY